MATKAAFITGGASGIGVETVRALATAGARVVVATRDQTKGQSVTATLRKETGSDKIEFEPLDLDAQDKDGNPVIPENSHVRLSNQATNNGAQILRRSYSYNDGTNFYIERWPPWRQETEYDAGLIFIAYQGDPRTGFIPINEKLSKFDMMNQFTTHVGSAVFACPPGVRPGSFIGAGLFET